MAGRECPGCLTGALPSLDFVRYTSARARWRTTSGGYAGDLERHLVVVGELRLGRLEDGLGHLILNLNLYVRLGLLGS